MEKALIKAKEGGYMTYFIEDADILLDKDFWQALGKSLNWGECISAFENNYTADWKYHWHAFIDHLAEGKDIESFFSELLADK